MITGITGENGEITLQFQSSKKFILGKNSILDIGDLREIQEKELFLYLMSKKVEKIELVTDRTGASYKEAKEALEATEGNVVDAIIYIEEKLDEKKRFFFKGDKNKEIDEEKEAIIEKLKAVVEKGNVSRIVFKKDGEIFLNIPVNAGAIGILLAPWAALAGTAAALITKCKIEIIKDDGEGSN